MSHRSSKTFRRTSAQRPRPLLLVAGVALVLAALAMSRCEPPDDLLGGPLRTVLEDRGAY